MAEKKKYNYIKIGFRFDGVHYVVAGKTQEEAIAKKIAKLESLRSGQIDSSKTVKDWAEVWYQTYVQHRKITAKSKRMYRETLDNKILPEIGKVQLRKVTSLRLQQLLNAHAGESKSSAEKLRMVIKGLFGQAFANRLLPFDPSVDLSLPETTEGKHRRLTDEERAALMTVASMPTFDGKPNRSGCWLMLMLRCGLRPGETAALRKADVDLKARTVRVRSARESGSGRVKDPKTASGLRTVPIPEDLVPWLKTQLAADSSPWLFTQKDKKTPLTETSMRRRWETVKKHMDIVLGAKAEKVKMPGGRRRTLVILEHALAEDLDLYDLRHTYCTDLEIAGVPINVAKTLMGHKDISTTANIYTHSSPETVETARVLLNAAVAKPVETANPDDQ